MLEFVLERYNYWAIIILMMLGLYICFQSANMIKRLVGLSIFQTSVFLFYITLSKVSGGTAPILIGKDAKGHYGDYPTGPAKFNDHQYVPDDSHGAGHGDETVLDDGLAAEGSRDAVAHGLEYVYSNPLPHVLILTAIVVGVATLSVGLAIVVRTREAYGTIETDEVRDADIETGLAESEAAA